MSSGTQPVAAMHRLAVFTACATAFLIFAGGLVTSTDSGLAVPDWPLSYGMVMPPMVGGIFYEHGHRMVAAFVGFLTVIMTAWMFAREDRAWLKRLQAAALATVIAQGVLGGITVWYLLPRPVSVAHACLAQAFFCLTIAIALFTSPEWKRGYSRLECVSRIHPWTLSVSATVVVFVQLVLGASMRHLKSGLAIPDFPLAFGQLVPPMTSEGVVIHFAHRVWAVVVAGVVLTAAFRIVSDYGHVPELFRPAVTLAALLCVQLLLGALTIWTGKAVLPTTAHVTTGALILGTSVLLALRVYAMIGTSRLPDPAGSERRIKGMGLRAA